MVAAGLLHEAEKILAGCMFVGMDAGNVVGVQQRLQQVRLGLVAIAKELGNGGAAKADS